jgi:heptosyltransferase-2
MNKKRILIIGPAWVGDMVMAQTLFRLLKQQTPDAIIDVLAPDWTRALLNRMPEVNNAISMPIGHGEFNFKKRFALGRELRAKKYDEAFVLPNSFKSALIPFFAGIKKRIGWRGEMRYVLLNDVRILDKEKLPLMIERFMALALKPNESLKKPYLIPKLVIDETSRAHALIKHELKKDKPIFALCPGAEFGPSKRWPASYFAEVANKKLDEGYQVWMFGSKNDLPITDEILKLTHNRVINLAGKTSLDEAIDLLSLAELVISNDSGLMHIAAALNKTLVALYGSTSTKFTPPLGNKIKILNLNLECSPCFKRECPLGHWKCMKDLKPDMALQAIKEIEEKKA